MKNFLGRMFLSALLLVQSVIPAVGSESFVTGPVPAVAPASPAASVSAEARKVHLILTGLAGNADIGPLCRQDLLAMQEQFTRAFQQLGPDRLEIHALYGDGWTKAKVLEHLRGMNIDANDVVIFYQSGHGAIRNASQPQSSQVIQLSAHEYVSRGELQEILRQKASRGIVMMTDCCSNVVGLGRESNEGREPNRSTVVLNGATIRNLFLRFHGFVDLTAAEVGASASAQNSLNNFGGASSAFTVAFLSVAAENQTFQNWSEFYGALRQKTQEASGGGHRAFAYQISENGTAVVSTGAPTASPTQPCNSGCQTPRPEPRK